MKKINSSTLLLVFLLASCFLGYRLSPAAARARQQRHERELKNLEKKKSQAQT
jgi:hypothetical protein